jgi:hypothetical protein
MRSFPLSIAVCWCQKRREIRVRGHLSEVALGIQDSSRLTTSPPAAASSHPWKSDSRIRRIGRRSLPRRSARRRPARISLRMNQCDESVRAAASLTRMSFSLWASITAYPAFLLRPARSQPGGPAGQGGISTTSSMYTSTRMWLMVDRVPSARRARARRLSRRTRNDVERLRGGRLRGRRHRRTRPAGEKCRGICTSPTSLSSTN